MSLKSLFHTEIYVASIPSVQNNKMNGLNSLRKECLIYAEEDRLGQEWSKKNYLGGYTSYGSLDKMHLISGTFAELEKAINKHVKNYVKKLEWDISNPCLEMTNCWINIMPAFVTHSWHSHPHSLISGTFYVDVQENTSAIKFEDPRWPYFMKSPKIKEKAASHHQRFFSVKPKNNQVVLFESWLKHEVPAHPSKHNRISISFNYDLREP